MQAFFSNKQAEFYKNGRQAYSGEKFAGLNLYRIIGKDIYITITSIRSDDPSAAKYKDFEALPAIDDRSGYGGMANPEYPFLMAVAEVDRKRAKRGKLTEEEIETAKQLARDLVDAEKAKG